MLILTRKEAETVRQVIESLTTVQAVPRSIEFLSGTIVRVYPSGAMTLLKEMEFERFDSVQAFSIAYGLE